MEEGFGSVKINIGFVQPLAQQLSTHFVFTRPHRFTLPFIF